MGIFCNDKSMTALARLGYNVVRHPSANFRPLMLIGKQGADFLQLGTLNQLITNAAGPLPAVTAGEEGAGISGETSNKLDLGIGANILGNLIGAMGGNLGVNISYTDARRVEFKYTGVTIDSIVPLDVGSYLRDGTVDASNLVLQQYVLGNGSLYIVTKVARSNKFTVSYERKNSTGAKVDVPALQALASANVNVSVDAQNASVVTFEGPTKLGFAFQAVEVGVFEGVLSLTTVKAGAVTAAAGADLSTPPPIAPTALFDFR